jgi:hypothetical protein
MSEGHTSILEQEKKELSFNRQFILSPRSLDIPEDWNSIELDSRSYLYSHYNLEFTQSKSNQRTLILLGFLLDPLNPEKTNQQILDAISQIEGFDKVLANTFGYAGKFILFYKDVDAFKVFHDATGLKELFYFKHKKNIWCASQPNLIKKYTELELDENTAQFYSSPIFFKRKERIADTTQYKSLKHLSANYHLNLFTGKSERYYPDQKLIPVKLDLAVDESVIILKGIFAAISFRHKLLIAVTAGMDSRMMLAGSHSLPDKPTYFILKTNNLTDNHFDIKTPKSLFKKMGLMFNIIEYSENVDLEIKENIIRTAELINPTHIAPFYNVHYKKHKGFMNIISVSEFARNYYHYQANSESISGKTLARLNGFEGIEFIETTYGDWINENAMVFKERGFNILDMFYWEEKMGNWLANGRTATNTFIDDFSPFNCKNLMTLFLSVDEKYRDRYNPIFHKKIIERMSKD